MTEEMRKMMRRCDMDVDDEGTNDNDVDEEKDVSKQKRCKRV